MANIAVIDFPVQATPANGDVLWLTRGIGVSRDYQVDIEDLQTYMATDLIATPDLGINIDPTSELFHINALDSGAARMHFTNTTTGTGALNGLTIGVEPAEDVYIRNYYNSDIEFYTNNVGRMRITNLGDAGLVSGIGVDNTLTSGPFFALGDSDTGIGQDGTDTLAMFTGGVERVTIDSSGNIGINENTPVAKLHIHADTSAGFTGIILTNTDTGETSGDGTIIGMSSLEESFFWNNENQALYFGTNNLERLRITSDGILSTGDEPDPDATFGGMTLNQGAFSGNIFTFKSSDVAHGITTWAETDTYAQFKKESAGNGGLKITGYSELTTGLMLEGYATTESAFVAPVEVDVFLKSGTTRTTLANTSELFEVNNNGGRRFAVLGNGDVKSSTGSYTAFDDEDDINLVRTLNAMFYKGSVKRDIYEKLIKNNSKKLKEIGVLTEEGFRSHNNSWALNTGAIGQLFNIIKNIGKFLNLTETQLLEFSKDYD